MSSTTVILSGTRGINFDGATGPFAESEGIVTVPVSEASGGITQLTGDVTAGPGSGSEAATLATVNANVGSFASANITVDSKGRITAATNGDGNPLSGMTTGFVPLAGSSNTITGDAHIDDGITVAGTLTATEPLDVNNGGQTVSLNAGIILQSAPQTTVAGSLGGLALFSMPFQGSGLKLVVIQMLALHGTASYTFPTPFVDQGDKFLGLEVAATSGSISALTQTALTVTGASSANGIAFVIGY